jgi:hypothetical protein
VVWPVISAIVLGVVLGIIRAAVARVMYRRSFAAVPAIIAERYDVLVDAEYAEERVQPAWFAGCCGALLMRSQLSGSQYR